MITHLDRASVIEYRSSIYVSSRQIDYESHHKERELRTRIDHLKYMKTFRCVGSECPFNCCSSWTIPLTKEDIGRLDRHREKLGTLKAHFNIEQMQISKGTHGNCALLDDVGWCRAQQAAGHGVLPTACQTYPRQLHQLEDTIQLSGELSCPEIARLIIENEDSCLEEPKVKRQFPEKLIKSKRMDLTQRERTLLGLNLMLISSLNDKDTPFDSLGHWVMRSANILGEAVLQKSHFPKGTRSRVNDIVFNDFLMLMQREGGGPFAKLWLEIQPKLPKQQNELDGDAILKEARKELKKRWSSKTRHGIMSRILIASLHAKPLIGKQYWSEMRQLFLQVALVGIGAAFLDREGNSPMIESLYAQSRLFAHSKNMATQLKPLFDAAGLSEQVGAILMLDFMQQIWGNA